MTIQYKTKGVCSQQMNVKIEDGVVGGYKKIESGAVNTFNKVSDKFIGEFFTHDGETVEEAKKRLSKK